MIINVAKNFFGLISDQYLEELTEISSKNCIDFLISIDKR